MEEKDYTVTQVWQDGVGKAGDVKRERDESRLREDLREAAWN